MIKNNMPYDRLRTQHRMRPEISSLLRPHIYTDLEDDESVRIVRRSLLWVWVDHLVQATEVAW